uniref:Uncharacterized protein n=1 Tax=Anguilla anguilla TaxID=7936 RepID=A0A0E9U2X4_ANGAN
MGFVTSASTAPGDRKFTPVSHPGPLKRTDPSAIRKQPAEGGL